LKEGKEAKEKSPGRGGSKLLWAPRNGKGRGWNPKWRRGGTGEKKTMSGN